MPLEKMRKTEKTLKDADCSDRNERFNLGQGYRRRSRCSKVTSDKEKLPSKSQAGNA